MAVHTTPSAIERVVSVAVFPLALAFALFAPVYLVAWGVPAPVAQLSVFVLAMFLSWIAERFVPFHSTWSEAAKRERLTDLFSLGTVMFVVDPLMKGGLILGVSWLAGWAAHPGGVGASIGTLPYLGALAITLLVAEFTPYWLHRFAHQPGWLWRFHSIHHSPRRIYWLNAFRSHPVNIVWYIGATFGVLLVLGFPAELIQGYLAISTVAGVFQHCNGRLNHGPLNWIFSTNQHHRWHHDLARDLRNCNYGSVLIVWDRLFGTFYGSRTPGPDAVGIQSPAELSTEGYWGLLKAPHVARYWSKAKNPDSVT